MLDINFRAHTGPICNELKLLKFDNIFKYSVFCFMHQFSTSSLPQSFIGKFNLIRETDELNVRDNFYHYQESIPTKHIFQDSFSLPFGTHFLPKSSAKSPIKSLKNIVKYLS